MKRRATVATILVLLVLGGSCSRPPEESGGIVATIPPLAAILREITGDALPVRTLLQGNASPHTYEPRPSDALAAEDALALFYVDPTLDGWAAGLPAKEKIAVFPMVPDEDILEVSVEAQATEADYHHGHEDGHSHNSHFWSDPLIVRAIVPELVQVLARLNPARAAAFEANGTAFSARLQQLHEATAAGLAPARGRSVALFHPSWDYFLQRYGIVVAAYIEPVPGKDLSPQRLERLINRLKDSGTMAV
ncbi:MAG: zinc ABC transporter substrate-binding protein, partial [Candidatus Hydrogenedentes bacterium]|nr:zinc ABC transporter substrate-binding protein [Candidatus Hydrogenedentota bacterium]